MYVINLLCVEELGFLNEAYFLPQETFIYHYLIQNTIGEIKKKHSLLFLKKQREMVCE